MASRFREYAGLLKIAALSALLCLLPAPAELRAESGPEEPLSVVLARSPDQAVSGGSLAITLYVDHPKPAEVAIEPPAFPSAFILERTKVEPRSLPGTGSTGKRWTAVEYVFTVVAAGAHRIGPFVIRAGGKRAATEPLTIPVEDSAPANIPKTLYWKGAPAAVTVGEPFELSLILSGAAAESPRPEVSIPENAIFSKLPLSAEDLRAGTAARFRVTLLDSSPFRLPPATLRLPDGTILASAPLALPVSAARVPAEGAKPSSKAGGPPVPKQKPAAAPPAFPRTPYPRLYRPWLEPVYSAARSHWERREYASALAVLRAAERDSPLGFSVRAVRKGAEEALGLVPVHDERYAPFVPLAAIAITGAALAALFGAPLAAAALKRKLVTSARRRRFIIVFLAASISALASFRLLYAAAGARENVILSACSAFRVPDPISARSAEFAEGQAGRSRASIGDGKSGWMYVELEDGRSGWIEAVRARRY